MRNAHVRPIRLSVVIVLLLCVGFSLACQPLTEPYPVGLSSSRDTGVTASVTERRSTDDPAWTFELQPEE